MIGRNEVSGRVRCLSCDEMVCVGPSNGEIRSPQSEARRGRTDVASVRGEKKVEDTGCGGGESGVSYKEWRGWVG